MGDTAELRARVAAANVALHDADLVALSFGNVSAVDRSAGLLVIKASGVPCATCRPQDTVAVNLDDGRVLDSELRPSSDTPTHRRLYQAFPEIGGVVHTHSPNATAWAQAGRPIPCLGTTHADVFRGAVPVSRDLLTSEIGAEYEWNTGEVIAEAVREAGRSALDSPAVLVRSHGPFTWGTSPEDAVEIAIALEIVAGLATQTLAIAPTVELDPTLLTRHFDRKHGTGAYYGQTGKAGRRGQS